MRIKTKRSEVVDLGRITLSEGEHDSYQEGTCVMEMVSYVAGEEFSDHPKCASEMLTEAAIMINDEISDDVERTRLLAPLILKLVGTRAPKSVDDRRGYAMCDFVVHDLFAVEHASKRSLGDRDLLERLELEECGRLASKMPRIRGEVSRKAALKVFRSIAEIYYRCGWGDGLTQLVGDLLDTKPHSMYLDGLAVLRGRELAAVVKKLGEVADIGRRKPRDKRAVEKPALGACKVVQDSPQAKAAERVMVAT